MTDGYQFALGTLVFPLQAPTGNGTLADLDPALNNILNFVTAVIQDNNGYRWDIEVANLGLSLPIVGQSVGFPVSNLLSQENFTFPLLQVFREADEYIATNINLSSVKSTVKVVYSLPPLSVEQYSLYAFLHDISGSVSLKLRQGYDPQVNSGNNIVKNQIEILAIEGAQYGNMPGLANGVEILFPTISMTLQVSERETDVLSNWQPIEALELFVDAATQDGYPPAFSVDGYFLFPPTITAVSPHQGSSLGGTTIQISGSGLSSIVQVQVGTATLNSLYVSGDDLILGITQPNIAGMTNITLTDTAGNTYTFNNEYTYL